MRGLVSIALVALLLLGGGRAGSAATTATLDVFVKECLGVLTERRDQDDGDALKQIYRLPFNVFAAEDPDLVMLANGTGSDCSVGERAARAGTFEASKAWADNLVASGRFREFPAKNGRLREIEMFAETDMFVVRLSKVRNGGYSLGAWRYAPNPRN